MMKSFNRILILFMMAGPVSLCAQPSFPPPSGVFCSCCPTTGTGTGSVNPSIAAKSFVKGILVRVAWDKCEPKDDIYNWILIDGQITAAKTYEKKISLAIGAGGGIPQWVFKLGAQAIISLSPPTNDTIAAPWDGIYLSKWTGFISELGKRYRNDTTIQLVYMTNSSTNGYEMQLPYNSSPSLSAIGYSDAKMISSWKSVIDAFNSAFPNHYLSNDFHPVNNSNAVADSVYAFAVSKIGHRYGANAWWWTQKNTTVYPSQFNILKNSAANNAFTGVQMAYNGTSDGSSFGEGGLEGALQLAITNKICYWELWNQDILNPDFEPLLTNASCSLTTGITKISESGFLVFPNPTEGSFIVKNASGAIRKIELLSLTGKLLLQQTSPEVFLNNLLNGIYIVRIECDQDTYTTKIVHY